MKDGFKIIDSDMHIMEPVDLWQTYMDKKFRSQAPIGVRTEEHIRSLRMMWPGDPDDLAGTSVRHYGHNFDAGQVTYRSHYDRGWTSDVQLEAMDVEGLDVAVMYPSRGLGVLTWPNMDSDLAAAISRAYNDWLYDFCQRDPDRMLGAGMISVYNIDDAVSEARRAVKELGFRAVFLRSNVVVGKPWHDPYFEPLWHTLEELGIPLGFHEATSSHSRQAGEQFNPNFGLRRVYAQPLEQIMGLGSFLAGGILERHPDLKIAFLEANCSWLPWLLWRLDEGYEREADAYMEDLKQAPTEYFKRQCWVSVEPDELPAKYAMDWIGCDQMVFSTDYPHTDSRFPDAVNAFLELDISDEDKRKILWDNCARFYKLEVASSLTKEG